MPFFTLETDPIGTRALWQLTENDEQLEALCAGLPLGNGEGLWVEACQRFRAPARRAQWVAARLLLSRLGLPPTSIAYLPSGRPIVRISQDTAPQSLMPHEVSISHTHGYVAVIVSDNPVGIDIEQIGPRVHRVASRFIDPATLPADLNFDELTRYLLLHWSAREAIFKCLDLPGVDFREHLHIHPFTLQSAGTMQAWETRTDERRQYAVAYRVEQDFVLTWCKG